MEFLLNRYRNLTVLLIVIVAQLVLIAYRVKTKKDVPLIRVWAVTAVTPVEQGLEFVRRNTIGRVEDYFYLLGVKSDNDRLRKEVGQLKIENNFLRSELSTADRLRALGAFEARSPSKMLAARIIGNGTGANSKVVFVDRGSGVGVESGMAVVTPDGIAGKVVDAYPTASLVMLVSDPTFAAGVLSQNNRLHGTLKGQGHGACIVDYIQNEQKVDVGEWFYTSGDDRIFPKGFPVGQVTAVRNGKAFKEILLTPSGLQNGVEEVLILLQGVHLQLPENQIASPAYKLLPPPPASSSDQPANAESGAVLSTDADRLKEQYREAAKAQNHPFGEGYKPPDFTKLGAPPPPAAPHKTGAPAGTAAGATTPGPPVHRTRPPGTAADLSAPGHATRTPSNGAAGEATPVHRTRPPGTAADLTGPGHATRTPSNGAASAPGEATQTAPVHRTRPPGTAADLTGPGHATHTPSNGAASGSGEPAPVGRTRPPGTAADLTAPGHATRTPSNGVASGSGEAAPVHRTRAPGTAADLTGPGRATRTPSNGAASASGEATPVHRTRPPGTAADLTGPGHATRTPSNGAASASGETAPVRRTRPPGTAADQTAPGAPAHRAVAPPPAPQSGGLATGTPVRRTGPPGAATSTPASKTTTTGQQPSDAGAPHVTKRPAAARPTTPADADPGSPPAAKPKPKAAPPPKTPNPAP